MRIIISPAKKMKVDTDSLPWRSLPAFLRNTEEIYGELRKKSYGELKALWKCNDSIADQNVQRLQTMDLHAGLTPAVLSYEGIQYRYMAPGVFTQREFEYVQEHLRILSGLISYFLVFSSMFLKYVCPLTLLSKTREIPSFFWSLFFKSSGYSDSTPQASAIVISETLCNPEYLQL